MYIYFLLIPHCAVSIAVFTLTAFKIGTKSTNLSLFGLSGLFMVCMMVFMFIFTVKTWRTVSDHIFVRGELVCQELILAVTQSVMAVIYDMDRREWSPENELSPSAAAPQNIGCPI